MVSVDDTYASPTPALKLVELRSPTAALVYSAPTTEIEKRGFEVPFCFIFCFSVFFFRSFFFLLLLLFF
jgi:hypothetical protein